MNFVLLFSAKNQQHSTSFQLNENSYGGEKKNEFIPLWRLNYFYYVFDDGKNDVNAPDPKMEFQTNSLRMHSTREVRNMEWNLWR